MSQRQQVQQDRTPQDEGIIGRLKELLGMGEPEATPQGVIQGVDIAKLIEYVMAERPGAEVEEEAETKAITVLRENMGRLETFSRELIDVFVRDGLSRIYHPTFGDANLHARLGIIAQMLGSIVHDAWKYARQVMRHGDPETMRQWLEAAYRVSRLALLVMVEVYNKMIVIFHTNAPAMARPPLVNVSLGYDLLQRQV